MCRYAASKVNLTIGLFLLFIVFNHKDLREYEVLHLNHHSYGELFTITDNIAVEI
jgi:hypothetical protein